MKDIFMYNTIGEIMKENGIEKNLAMQEMIYTNLAKETTSQGKSWNCKMIDKYIEKFK